MDPHKVRRKGAMVKVFLTVASVFVTTSALPIPAVAASAPKPGTRCIKVGTSITTAGKRYSCVKSKSRLLWSKGVPVTKISQDATANYYRPNDSTTIYKIEDVEGCAVAFDADQKQVTFVQLFAQVGDQWLEVKTSEIGWEKRCNDPRLPNNKYFAYAKAAVDDGTVLRWKFTGPVNIEFRDAEGHGYSHPVTFRTPASIVQPHAISGNYGITWENLPNRVNDISAAAWTDAQATIKRNEGQPSGFDNFRYYLSPGALANEPRLADVIAYMKRMFALFAKIPHAKDTIFVALTHAERTPVETLIVSMTPHAQLLNANIDSMFGVKPTQPEGSIYTAPTCANGGSGRANNSYPSTRDLSFIVIGVCPPAPGQDPYKAATRGVPHEYVHTIQNAFATGITAMQATPCWMREGQAEWGQASVANSFEEYLGRQSFHPFYLTATGLNFQATSAREWTAQEVQDYLVSSSNTATCALSNEYSISASLGHAAIEALASIGGAESVFAINSRLAVGESLEQAFTEVYDIPWSKALPILASAVARKITLSWTPQALTYQTRP